MKYWADFNRLTKRYEAIYAVKINKALKDQIEAYIKTGDINSISGDNISDILLDMYKDVGVEWAFQSGKFIRVKKARRPLGFTERLVRLLQAQYGPDILNMSSNIEQTTKDQVRATLMMAADKGWSIDEITRQLRRTELTTSRARLISRTEVIGAANAGAMVNAQDLGATTKIWISTIDARTRDDHKTLDGQRRAFNEPFTVVDKEGITRSMMQPGDKNGGPAQVCNCRCAVGFE